MQMQVAGKKYGRALRLAAPPDRMNNDKLSGPVHTVTVGESRLDKVPRMIQALADGKLPFELLTMITEDLDQSIYSGHGNIVEDSCTTAHQVALTLFHDNIVVASYLKNIVETALLKFATIRIYFHPET